MRLLGLTISLCLISWSAMAEPVRDQEGVRTELDQVLEEGAGRPSSRYYQDPFYDTPHLSDFPRIGRPYAPPAGFYQHYYYYGVPVRPRPVPQPVPQATGCSGWEKVHKVPGDIEIVNGCRVVIQTESWTSSVAGVAVPSWAVWYRHCSNGPQFAQ